MLGRTFNGLGKPRDNGPTIVSKQKFDLVGSGINPYSEKNHLNLSKQECLTLME